MGQARLLANHQPLIFLLGKMMLLAVVIIGGLQVIAKRMSLGDLGAFLEYANNVIWPMEILGWLSNDHRICGGLLEKDSEGGKGDSADCRRGRCKAP